ncbi:MAG TPA: hypothetical protein VFC44_18400 [Candidatus Saccharimonadales bacterium]|nr:hypothetical protein [Candidatus Saccharimonadales bacterium]
MKSTSGRISVQNRQALVSPATALAKAHDLTINRVMSAVLWKGERLAGRISLKALTGIVTTGTVAEYEANVARRALARRTQLAGMVKAALPVDQRTPENIDRLTTTLGEAAGLSISALQAAIREIVGTSPAAEVAS